MEQQINELKKLLSGKRVGLLVNPTSVNSNYTHLIDLLRADAHIHITALFGPEHGVRGVGQAGEHMSDSVDPVTGIPVFELYGQRQSPTPEQLDLIDVLVFDIQDAGARFYTFCWSMTYAMEACAAAGKEFVVFDRPNPIGGVAVEGAPLKFDCGIIGRYWSGTAMSVAVRHGLTMGEFATLVNEEFLSPKVALKVVRMPSWRRAMPFAETGYPWVMPSPNLPTVECAFIYTGTCVFEGSNISEGRGTTKPFEFTGAPWVDGDALAKHMNAKALPGIRFRPVAFKPTFSKGKDEVCCGVQLHVIDRAKFSGVAAGLHLLKGYVELYPDKVQLRDWCDKLTGVRGLCTRIFNESPETFVTEWQDDLETFKKMRARYLLYNN